MAPKEFDPSSGPHFLGTEEAVADTLPPDHMAPEGVRRGAVLAVGAGSLSVGEASGDGTHGHRPSLAEVDAERYELLSHPGDVFRKVLDRHTREVIVESEIGVRDYDQLAEQLGPWAVRDMGYLKKRAAVLAKYNPHVEEVNPTANGGGVQMILATQTNLLNKVGEDTPGEGVDDTDEGGRIHDHWRLMFPNDRAFRVTKDWHNTFQGVAQHSREHLQRGFATYEEWIRDENAEPLRPYLQQASIVTIHDPQPHLLIEDIPAETPIAWRSHIQNRTDLIGRPGSPQELVWNYVNKGKVERAAAQVYHPVEEFVPHNVPDNRVNFGPATFDPFDDLNRLNLTAEERREGREFIDEQLRMSRLLKPEDRPIDEDWSQEGIDWDRPVISLIARFDPSKGMPEAVKAYLRAREIMIEKGDGDKVPQLVILGNGSVDDPDGIIELNKMMGIRAEIDEDIRSDVKVIRVPHNDMAINTLMHEARFGLQPSLFEGFETRASDWIWHGKPVIVSSRGGLPLQVHEGKSGHIVDPEDTEAFAQCIAEMSSDEAKYQDMCRWSEELGKTYNYREFSTVANAIRWVDLYIDLLEGRANGSRRWRISEIVDGESEEASTARLRGSLGSLAVAG